ncbi:MAG: hypothetical protein ACTS6J_11875 [Burkholderiales bacterium]
MRSMPFSAAIGRRREACIRELVDEGVNDSAVRVSVLARVEGIAAGFVMARTGFGDYGRASTHAARSGSAIVSSR